MKRLLSLLFIAALMPGFGKAFAQAAQGDCDQNTIDANEALYGIGRFDECIAGLRQCLDHNGFRHNDEARALQLIAKCYLAIDARKQADTFIERLLRLDDNFQPGNDDPQRFKNEIEIIQGKLRATQVTSVSKKSEDMDLAPATIQVITEEDIQRRGYKDIEEIFSDLPGFDVTRSRGVSYSVLYQRGYRTSLNTDRTLFLVDGVEDNDMWSNAAYIGKQFPVANIKRIEIIYGPASTIYGANAYAGVVNIITKSEQDLFPNGKRANVTATGQAGYGSFNTYYANTTLAARSKNVFLSVTGGVYHSDEEDLSQYPAWDGKYAFSDASYESALSVKYSQKADSILGVLDPSNTYHTSSKDSIRPTAYAISKAKTLDQTNYRKTYRGVDPGRFTDPKNDYYFSSKLSVGDFKLQLEYFNRDEGITPDYTEKYSALNSTLQDWQVRQGYIALRYDKKLGSRFTLSSFSYYRVSDRGKNSVLTTYSSYENGGLKAGDGTQLDSLIRGANPYFRSTYKSVQSNQFRSELRGQYVLNEKVDFTGGLELRNGLFQGDYVNSSLPDPLATGYAHDSASFYSISDLGVFLLGTYANTQKKFNIDLGGRVDNNVNNAGYGYGSVFNPRVALIYYPGKFVFKSIYSEAFLDASLAAKFGTATGRLLAAPNLKPEKVRNMELSSKYRLSKRTYVEAAYYYSWYSNATVAATVDYFGSTTTQNQALGKARIQGLQLAGETDFNRFSIYANATFTEPYAVNTSAKGTDSLTRMGDIASFYANAGINIVLPANFNLNLRLNYVGDKPTGKGTTTSANPYTSTPGYTIFNGTLGYRIKKAGIVQFRCDNMLDAAYYSPGVRSGAGVQTSRVPQPGRIYYVQYTLNLN